MGQEAEEKFFGIVSETVREQRVWLVGGDHTLEITFIIIIATLPLIANYLIKFYNMHLSKSARADLAQLDSTNRKNRGILMSDLEAITQLLLDERSSIKELREQEKKYRARRDRNAVKSLLTTALLGVIFGLVAAAWIVTAYRSSSNPGGSILGAVLLLAMFASVIVLLYDYTKNVGRNDVILEMIDETIKKRLPDGEPIDQQA